jgi:DNA repair protein RadC
MRENSKEAELLAKAVAESDANIEHLSAQLQSVGGLRALNWGGAELLDSVLSPMAVQRLEDLLCVAECLYSPPKLGALIDNAEAVAAYFQPRLAGRRTESFWVLFLDARGRPLGEACIAEGTLTACLVHPREVFAAAIRARAAQIILVHNHPSGDPQPSAEDLSLTERLTEVGVLLGIPVVDHVIVAAEGFRSI